MSGDPRHVFAVTERFDPAVMQAVMRHDSIYWSATDALAPQPEQCDFIERLTHPYTFTLAGTYNGNIVGYVQFIKRTSIMAEIHTGFLPPFRGKFAKAVIEQSIYTAFAEKGLTKLLAMIPSDNVAAIRLAGLIGFHREGRLTRAMVRNLGDNTPEGSRGGVMDIVILALDKTRIN